MADEVLVLDANKRNVAGGTTTGGEIRVLAVDEDGRIILASDSSVTLALQTVTAATGSRSTAGTTNLIAAPGAGNKIRLHHLTAVPKPDATGFPLITFEGTGGADVEVGYAIGTSPRSYLLELPPNEGLDVVTDAAGQIGFTAHYTIEAV